MKRKLHGLLLGIAGDEATADDERADALVEAAETNGDALRAILDGGALPASPDELSRLVETAGGDGAAAIAAAREDGHVFDGDELSSEGVEVFETTGRLLEARTTPTGERRHVFVAIRPCEGGGPGARIYTADALRRSVESKAFTGQPMFFNHEDLGTIIKRGHGSRDPRDLAGWITGESWDGAYTEPDDAKNGYGPGAVLIEAKLRTVAEQLVAELPEAVKASINMAPTRLTAKRRKDGKLGSLVEALKPQSGAVDLVTLAGAGGHYLERLREAPALGYAPDDAEPHASELSDDAVAAIVEARPELAARLREAPAPPDHNPEEPVSEITTDQLVEALQSPDGAAALDRLVEARVDAAIAEREDAIRDEAQAEARADAQRQFDLRDMRDQAHRAIEAAPVLSQLHKDELFGRYNLRPDGTPTAQLDVYDRVDASGTVQAPALDVLMESVAADIKLEQDKLRAAFPTRVREVPSMPAEDGTGAAGADAGGGRTVEAGQGGSSAADDDPLAAALGLDPAAVRQNWSI